MADVQQTVATAKADAVAGAVKATTFVEKQAAWLVANPKKAVLAVIAYTAAVAFAAHVL